MTTDDSFNSVCDFIAEYAAHLMGVGVHTSRVVRNSKRIGEAFGVKVQMCAFYNNIMISIVDDETHVGNLRAGLFAELQLVAVIAAHFVGLLEFAQLSMAEHINLATRLQNKGIELIATAQDFGTTNEAKIMALEKCACGRNCIIKASKAIRSILPLRL